MMTGPVSMWDDKQFVEQQEAVKAHLRTLLDHRHIQSVDYSDNNVNSDSMTITIKLFPTA